jgi:hypothetical protein
MTCGTIPSIKSNQWCYPCHKAFLYNVGVDYCADSFVIPNSNHFIVHILRITTFFLEDLYKVGVLTCPTVVLGGGLNSTWHC